MSVQEDLDIRDRTVTSLMKDYDLICKKIIDDSAQERLDIWREKEKDVGQLEKEYKHRRRQISTGVLCSQNVATCIAEYISGEPQRPSIVHINFYKDLYCFAIAIRSKGEDWPYLINLALRMSRERLYFTEVHKFLNGKIHSWTARPLIGELCRLGCISGDEFVVFPRASDFTVRRGDIDTEGLLDSIICHTNDNWFEDNYLIKPYHLPLKSGIWKRRLLIGYPVCNQRGYPLVEYMDEAFQLPVEKEKSCFL